MTEVVFTIRLETSKNAQCDSETVHFLGTSGPLDNPLSSCLVPVRSPSLALRPPPFMNGFRSTAAATGSWSTVDLAEASGATNFVNTTTNEMLVCLHSTSETLTIIMIMNSRPHK